MNQEYSEGADHAAIRTVEAKAHTAEMRSKPTQARDENSILGIQTSLKETRAFLGSNTEHDWAGTYYQFTNRLAHLYLVRELNGLPAWLVCVYFTNAIDVHRPATREEWERTLEGVHTSLGLRSHPLSAYICDVYVDVGDLIGKL